MKVEAMKDKEHKLGLPFEYQQMPEYFDAHNVSEQTAAKNAVVEKLLKEQFEGKGFNNINLVTSAFNAPEFYKKCGFTVEFVRENKINPQLTKTFFIKYFKNERQTQGVIKSHE